MIQVFLVLAVLAVVFGVGAFLTGRAEGLSDEPQDLASVGIPRDRAMTADDVASLRFALALRGYRMDEVDDALDRLAAEIAARDELISRLRADLEAVAAREDAPVSRWDRPPAWGSEPQQPERPEEPDQPAEPDQPEPEKPQPFAPLEPIIPSEPPTPLAPPEPPAAPAPPTAAPPPWATGRRTADDYLPSDATGELADDTPVDVPTSPEGWAALTPEPTVPDPVTPEFVEPPAPNPFRPEVPEMPTYDPWAVTPRSRFTDGPAYVEVEHEDEVDPVETIAEHHTGYAPTAGAAAPDDDNDDGTNDDEPPARQAPPWQR